MSIFKASWQEVFFSMDQQEFFKCQNTLRENGIRFKVKTENNSLRASINNLDGRSAGLSRGSLPVKDYYKILVQREDADRAKYLFNK